MNPAQTTPTPASWRQLLDASVSPSAREVVVSLLSEIKDKKDSLSARLGFSKLNRLVRAANRDEDIIARAAFVAGLAELIPAAELPDVVTTLFRTGSEREQIGVLRALPLLPDGAGLVALAREASRTNDVTVFSALACDSTFPVRFLGVPVGRIEGIESRVTVELQRMISDYASERRAAGRPVPSEVPWLLGLPPTPARTT
jgi:hypothetical protein